VVTACPEETVLTAAQRMAHQEVGALVIPENSTPGSIITDRDLVLRVMAQGHDPQTVTPRTVMTPSLVWIPETATLQEAGASMRTYHSDSVSHGQTEGHVMPRQLSTGTCTFCQGTFSKGTMTRHLSACKQRQAELQAAATRGTGGPTKILHLLVDGYGPYWLHLDMQADARLDTLDTFLRNI